MMLEKENVKKEDLYFWDDDLPKEYNNEYDEDLFLDEDYYEGWD